MQNNICKFIPRPDDEKSINILNFVLETKKQIPDEIHCDAVYKMYFVTHGTGQIATGGTTYALNKGDIFFTFPSMRYSIESLNDFEYMYISYLGTRTNQIMDNLNITKGNFLFKEFEDLSLIWKNAIFDDTLVLSLRCEGILLYTFSNIAQIDEKKCQSQKDTVPKIKKYIDENFTSPELSLDTLSNTYSYNKKYISTVFKNTLGIGISQYITTLRVQHACTLIEQGLTSVKDISYLCGFNEPLYFSKVFKSKMGISPKGYIASSEN